MNNELKPVSRIAAIKAYFEADGARKLSMQEMKDLTDSDKNELASACAAHLGLTLVENPAK